jgi:hypothetical protein
MEKRESDRSDKGQEYQEEKSNERDASHRGKVFRLCHPFVEQLRVSGHPIAVDTIPNSATRCQGADPRSGGASRGGARSKRGSDGQGAFRSALRWPRVSKWRCPVLN